METQMNKLNLGCGKDIKEGWVNVDIQYAEDIDKSFNFDKFPYPFLDDEFDFVLVDNVLEHLENPIKVMQELWRICKEGATIQIIVPYYNTYWNYGDISHKHFFNELTIKQIIGDIDYNHNKQKEQFEILELTSIPQRFLKYIPMSILNVLKRFLGNVIIQLDVRIRVIKNVEGDENQNG